MWVASVSFGQAIMKAAKQMVFIIDEKQFVGTLDGAVPVLIQQVRTLRLFVNSFERCLTDSLKERTRF